MPRPRLFYVVWEEGRVVGIAEGRDAAKKIGPSFRAYRLRADAEEVAAWWTYERELRTQVLAEGRNHQPQNIQRRQRGNGQESHPNHSSNSFHLRLTNTKE